MDAERIKRRFQMTKVEMLYEKEKQEAVKEAVKEAEGEKEKAEKEAEQYKQLLLLNGIDPKLAETLN